MFLPFIPLEELQEFSRQAISPKFPPARNMEFLWTLLKNQKHREPTLL
jgi:hypothetical protein